MCQHYKNGARNHVYLRNSDFWLRYPRLLRILPLGYVHEWLLKRLAGGCVGWLVCLHCPGQYLYHSYHRIPKDYQYERGKSQMDHEVQGEGEVSMIVIIFILIQMNFWLKNTHFQVVTDIHRITPESQFQFGLNQLNIFSLLKIKKITNIKNLILPEF